MSELKQTLIDKVIDPLERPELYKKYDLGVENGILLYGPPGTGKTYITKALAGEIDCSYMELKSSEITSSLVGKSSDNVREIFETAKKNQPCIVFFDEIDGIASKRSGGAQKTQSERQMINQLLTEISEINEKKELDITIIGATNLKDEIDEAFTRPGRFNEKIKVPPPDAEARIAILRIHLRSRPVIKDKINWEEIKDFTEGYSASDLELIAKESARRALSESKKQNKLQKITQKHIKEAIDENPPSLAKKRSR
ncbi:MAG: ATPase of the AAA+ class CDC48 family [Candidatus Methanohalarchaeum thermophilum]|uniref:ATPase of the AAA+ class CDC48 family n=1 Tax=Methanohalarchaeum thermophilum TaxID=1903181 RepID=A0A1Q6DSM9_METT1|nr:MAG: ATPase of the AAA+ class CDC48 family [Candidatus Methanohalarchaeum thermophilum]